MAVVWGGVRTGHISVEHVGERIGGEQMIIVIEPQIERQIMREGAVFPDKDMGSRRRVIRFPAHEVAARTERQERMLRMHLKWKVARLWLKIRCIDFLNQRSLPLLARIVDHPIHRRH